MELAANIKFDGKAIPMTVLTPVKLWKRFLLRLILLVLRGRKLQERVRKLRFIHFARWAIVKSDAFSRPRPNYLVRHSYFLFSTNYNGPWDQYIDAFCLDPIIKLGVNALWCTSTKFPGAWPIRAFKRYIRYHEYPVDAYYNAYPGASIRDITLALNLQNSLRQFLAGAPTPQRDEFAPPFQKFLAIHPSHLRHAPCRTASAAAGSQPRFTRAPNQFTHLAVLTPIDYTMPVGSDAKYSSLTRLFERDRWEVIEENVFKKCCMVHMARFQIIDRLISGTGDQVPDRWSSKYLLFIAELDGTSDDFYDHLYRLDDGEIALRIWGNCLGYPTAATQRGEVFFRRYMRRFEIAATIPFAGADASVSEIRDALVLKSEWDAFLLDHPAWRT